MTITKAKTAATHKQQRNIKRTGSDKAAKGISRGASRRKNASGHAGAASTTDTASTADTGRPIRPDSKLATIIKLLNRKESATIAQMTDSTGWQKHSVRGVMSGALGKKRGLTITSVKTDGVRVYRVADGTEG